MAKLSIRDLKLRGQRVFIRADFNVPLNDDGTVADDTRIRETLPTIEYALNNQARVILASHLGRPKGKVNPKYSLRPVAERLRQLLDERIGRGKQVGFSTDCVGVQAEEMVAKLESSQTLLLENLRFHAEEEANEENFSRQLASLADVYVDDAFGAAHRAHASTVGMTKFLKQNAAGLLMERELQYLGKALEEPARPFVTILGGAKVSDKIGVIQNLLEKVDALLIGGGMAYTFLKAQGFEVGKSLVEQDKIEVARQTLEAARRATDKTGVRFLLPVDHVVAAEMKADAATAIIAPMQPIPADKMALDIGPRTIELFVQEIEQARTIVWNGPMGVFEMPPFACGTTEIAEAVAGNAQATSIIGGGDTVSAVHQAGVAEEITHISTGGGASLEFLEGRKLPGVEALTNK
ncbi:MAG TPA: phosphoglycerate kinase [Terriglobales bacterium]|nr:phosphoglycerate kinase [Terriglobales bacterium]